MSRIQFYARSQRERYAHADALCAAAFECDLRPCTYQSAWAADLADLLAQTIAQTVRQSIAQEAAQ